MPSFTFYENIFTLHFLCFSFTHSFTAIRPFLTRHEYVSKNTLLYSYGHFSSLRTHETRKYRGDDDEEILTTWIRIRRNKIRKKPSATPMMTTKRKCLQSGTGLDSYQFFCMVRSFLTTWMTPTKPLPL